MDENAIRSIIEIRKTLQEKLLNLKRRIDDENIQREKDLKPITEPLQELVKLNKKSHIIDNLEKRENSENSAPEENYENSAPESPVSIETDEDSVEPIKSDYQTEMIIQLFQKDKSKLDKTYGITITDENKLLIGNKPFKLENKTIFVGSLTYNATPGLLELLLLSKPYKYTESDLLSYKNILLQTKAHLNRYGRLKSNNGFKYKSIIKPLFSSKGGAGYTFWNDPNELVERLRLLTASKNAGHSNHNNEILSILEELRESKIIF